MNLSSIQPVWFRKNTVKGTMMLLVFTAILVMVRSWPETEVNTQVTLEYLGYRQRTDGNHVVLLELKNAGASPVSYYVYDGKYAQLSFKDSDPHPGFLCSLGPMPEFVTLQAGESKTIERSIDDLYGPWNVELDYYQGARGDRLWRYKEKLKEALHLAKPDSSYLKAKTRTVQETLISTSTLMREREVASWKEEMECEWEAKMAAQNIVP